MLLLLLLLLVSDLILYFFLVAVVVSSSFYIVVALFSFLCNFNIFFISSVLPNHSPFKNQDTGIMPVNLVCHSCGAPSKASSSRGCQQKVILFDPG